MKFLVVVTTPSIYHEQTTPTTPFVPVPDTHPPTTITTTLVPDCHGEKRYDYKDVIDLEEVP